MWESQKLRETEAKLHRKEQEMARGQKETSMLKLRLQEMQEKIEKGKRSTYMECTSYLNGGNPSSKYYMLSCILHSQFSM